MEILNRGFKKTKPLIISEHVMSFQVWGLRAKEIYKITAVVGQNTYALGKLTTGVPPPEHAHAAEEPDKPRDKATHAAPSV